MFDLGFSELLLIAVVALIVVGPERLPKVARTAGHLLGRLQRYVGDVKSDIQREMQLEDLKKLQQQVEQQARELENSLRGQVNSVEADLNKTAAELNEAVAGHDKTPAEDAVASASGSVLLAADAVAPDQASQEGGADEPQEPSPQLELGLDPAITVAQQSVEKA
jgi:sec-independent protein translocase protein TatB